MSLWSRWVQAVNSLETGESIAAFRVAVGLVQLGTVLTVVLHGLVAPLWLEVPDGGYRQELTPGFWFQWLGISPETVWMTIAGSVLSGVAMTLGLGGPVLSRLIAFASLQTTMALADLNGHAGGSYDQLLSNANWLLVLGSGTQTWSLNQRLRTGRWSSDQPVLAIFRWLVVVQLVLCYWSTGAQKVSVYWTPMGGYSALYYILQQPTWQRWDLSFFAYVYPLTQVLTASTWLFEWSAPLLLLIMHYRATPERPGRLRAWSNRARLRDLFILFGLGLHLGVMTLMDVGPFSPMTLAYYVAILTPTEWGGLMNRLRARLQQAKQGA